MFSVVYESLGQMQKVVIKNSTTNEFVSIVPSFGGSIHTLALKCGNRQVTVVKGSSDVDQFVSQQKKYFAGAKLFPFANRIKSAAYNYKGKTHQLHANDSFIKGNALHGLVYDKPFKDINSVISSDYATITLTYESDGKLQGYPFPFKIDLCYKLSDTGLTVRTTVTNSGNESMPFVDGWHPYLQTGTAVDSLQLKIPSTEFLDVDQDFIPTGTWQQDNTFLDFQDIGKTALNHCFKIEEGKALAQTVLRDVNKDIELTVWQETGKDKYNYVQLYTTPDGLQLAVEPMTGAPDAFNNKIGLLELAPNEVFTSSFGISLNKIG